MKYKIEFDGYQIKEEFFKAVNIWPEWLTKCLEKEEFQHGSLFYGRQNPEQIYFNNCGDIIKVEHNSYFMFDGNSISYFQEKEFETIFKDNNPPEIKIISKEDIEEEYTDGILQYAKTFYNEKNDWDELQKNFNDTYVEAISLIGNLIHYAENSKNKSGLILGS